MTLQYSTAQYGCAHSVQHPAMTEGGSKQVDSGLVLPNCLYTGSFVLLYNAVLLSHFKFWVDQITSDVNQHGSNQIIILPAESQFLEQLNATLLLLKCCRENFSGHKNKKSGV